MSKRAFVFPGQGSQFVGMASDLYESHSGARFILDRANAVLDFSLTDIMFGSAIEEDADFDVKRELEKGRLTETQNTQPALFVHSLAAFAAFGGSEQKPDMVAGHSLGEYSALAAAGAISFEDGLEIVRLRGDLMANAGNIRPGSMAAILGMEDADVVSLCQDVSGDGIVQPANFNSPGQVVISGDVEAIARAIALAPDRGARRALALPVSGAFHSPLMEYAKEGLAEGLARLDIQPPVCPVYLNVTAEPSRDPEEIRKRLVDQLTAPVRWAQTMIAMNAHGATQFVEIGAGRVLSGLAKRTLGREIETRAISSMADIESI